MKKQYTLFLFIQLFIFQANGQDLIVTNGGDSLKVKILEETTAAIFYQQNNKYGKPAELRIFKTLIKDFKYNVFETADKLPDDRLLKEQFGESQTSDYKDFMKFRVGFDVGYWRLLQAPTLPNTAFGKYQKKLNHGGNFCFQAGYFPFDRLGIGAKYHRFGSSNRASSTDYVNASGKTINGLVQDNPVLHFVAPVLYFRQAINYKTYATFGLSGGQVFYRNSGFRTDKFSTKAKTWGFGADLGVDLLQGNTAIGFDSGISFTLHYMYINLKKPDNQLLINDLSRFGLTIGLKFYKLPKYLRLTSY